MNPALPVLILYRNKWEGAPMENIVIFGLVALVLAGLGIITVIVLVIRERIRWTRPGRR